MSGDSPEDLSARLTELEATIRGLTQELVSATERIRELEAAMERRDAAAGEATRATRPDHDEPSDTAPETEPPDEEEGETDDIIVA